MVLFSICIDRLQNRHRHFHSRALKDVIPILGKYTLDTEVIVIVASYVQRCCILDTV